MAKSGARGKAESAQGTRWREIEALISIAGACYLAISFLSYSAGRPETNAGGPVGYFLADLVVQAFGLAAFLVPLSVAAVAVLVIRKVSLSLSTARGIALTVQLLLLATALGLLRGPGNETSGGRMGRRFSRHGPRGALQHGGRDDDRPDRTGHDIDDRDRGLDSWRRRGRGASGDGGARGAQRSLRPLARARRGAFGRAGRAATTSRAHARQGRAAARECPDHAADRDESVSAGTDGSSRQAGEEEGTPGGIPLRPGRSIRASPR